eukprot:TRINITY_DN18862_c0_g1_i1.p1 TRINITY_DN18862_c0_g1~~TRINITY_DN18862_c0_g1_i1.p1  ORF type:complete len:561 (-),score=106.20 TRINITY_DN18862_c0_g1_i1:127-1809(-)
MGSLDKYCRLCALNVRPDQLLKLFEDDPSKTETPNGAKLRNFLSFSITCEDRLPKQVCVQCISNLDYCIQFVDKCRRIESLLQRGLDVDYVASEVDYRYTYLFPSPYPSQDNRAAYPEFPDTGGPYFGSSHSPGQGSTNTNNPRNNENTGLNLSQIPDRVHPQHEQTNPESQFSSNHPNTYQPGRDNTPLQSRNNPAHPNDTHQREIRNTKPLANSNSETGFQATQPVVLTLNQEVPQNQTTSQTSPATSPPKPAHGQQKVAMYRNDVSVDNMVVEIEPNDLFPRKAGNVKQEYPWKVGGATKRSIALKDKKSEPEKKPDKESPPKKLRSIMPKFEAPAPKPLATSLTKGVNQIMIPVTLKTPCKSCNKLIVASSLNDLKNHICEGEDKTLDCIVTNCNKKFNNKNALKYHQKHCHNIIANLNAIKKDIDIMSIATNELVGCSDQSKPAVGFQMLENPNYPGNQPPNTQQIGITYQGQYPPNPSTSQQNLTNTTNQVTVTAKKVFACPYEGCSKSYNAKNYLVQHERLHTGERPYSCTNCGKGFSRVLDMKKHNLLKVCY